MSDLLYGRPVFFGLDGHDPVPVSMMEWATQAEVRAASIKLDGTDPWRVARTEFPGGGVLSTVFLGLDQKWWPDGPAILFETMLFGVEAEFSDRYATWDEAVAGHEAAAAMLARPSLETLLAGTEFEEWLS